MKTISDTIINQIEINKSIFITKIYKVSSLEEAKEKLINIKDEYKDATHYTYAYIIDDAKKSSDDGEPGGTAGVPIMNVLLKNELNYVLCIVIRYFGGIKLGAGGLVRAYTKAVVEALKNEFLIELVEGYLIKTTIDYQTQKNLDFLLKDFNVKKTYSDNIEYIIEIPKEELKVLKERNIEFSILENRHIKKNKANFK